MTLAYAHNFEHTMELMIFLERIDHTSAASSIREIYFDLE